MRAFVICGNDSIEAVCLDRQLAAATMERLAKEHYVKSGRFITMSFEEYRNIIYWHVHEVEVIK
jgi:hypothetical protein